VISNDENRTSSVGAKTVMVDDDDADARLDRWFKRHYPQVSHGLLERWLRTGQVRVDGGRAKAAYRVQPGQKVRIPPNQPAEVPAAPKRQVAEDDAQAILSCVLHRDDHVIVLNKPPGLAVQGGAGTKHHLDAMLGTLTFGGDRPKLVHRLDKDTSGVLVLARSIRAAAALADIFRGRQAEKIYWAIVSGVPKPESGEIRAGLAKRRGAGGERVQVDDQDGQWSTTHYQVVESASRRASWLRLTPKTGRTHQLRVHCAHLGTPVLGDGKYGGRAAFLPGNPVSKKVHLHARSLSLPHPGGGILNVSAPLPDHMVRTFRFFGFSESEGDSGACG
jgi:23S rRNA pseudouridine955/2504/2580 synthase